MCIAVPGIVVRIDGNLARLDFTGVQMNVALGLVDAAVGDYVLVHAGCAIEVMRPESAKDLLDLLQELKEAADDGDS